MMGLKEPVHGNEHRWSHPPKKKWIHCYLSIEEERKSEGVELKRSEIAVQRSADPHPVVTFAPHVTQPSTGNSLERRVVSLPSLSLSSPHRPSYTKGVQDDRHGQRRRAHHPSYASPSANERPTAQIGSTYQIAGAPVLNNSDVAVESSMELSSLLKGGPDSQTIDTSVRSLAVQVNQPTRLSPDHHSGSRLPPHNSNGFLRPSGASRSQSHSPLSREFEDFSKEDARKRAGNTPSREVHNKLEKNRRAHLKECFETLRRQLPSMEDKKISNQTILKAAHRYIQTLKRKEREYEHEMERLARQKIAHQQQLSALKKELQAKWDHIDFSAILPDMASLEQQNEKETKSTTTASEQPDLEEEDSHDSSGHSNSLTLTTSSPELKTPTYVSPTQPVDLTPTADVSYCNISTRETYMDPNQPLNLSTTGIQDAQKSPLRQDTQKSPLHYPSPAQSPQKRNGEWPVRRCTPLGGQQFCVDEKAINPGVNRIYSSQGATAVKISSPPCIGINRTTHSTNTTHISPLTIKGPPVSHFSAVTNASTAVTHIPLTIKGPSLSHLPAATNATAAVTHFSQLVKSGTSVSPVPSMAKVVTTFPNLNTLPHSGTTVTHLSHGSSVSSSMGQLHMINSSVATHPHLAHESNIQTVPATVSIGTTIAHVPHLATIARVSSATNITTAATGGSNQEQQQQHTIPIVGGNGISLPAQLVASGVHLSGPPGTLIRQPAIQVITPEGYKLIPAEHGPNGSKPLAITLSHSGGIEHLSSEDCKSGPLMVAVNKNGLSALHLTMPASARALTNSQGNSSPVTSVPLNLTVGATGTATVKVTQAGTGTSLIPSYIPLTHANGITQLVQGMSLVGPIVVSQSQRGVMVSTTAPGNKVTKSHGSTTNSGTSVPLVPAQYASMSGGLVNSVVVVSAADTAVSHHGSGPSVVAASISAIKQ